MDYSTGLSCTLCDKSYKSKESFLSHINKHNGVKPHHCLECPAKFTSQSSLSTHKKIHTGVMKLNCPKCDLVISSKKNLIRHIDRHHNDKKLKMEKDTMKEHACHVCFARFTKSKNLYKIWSKIKENLSLLFHFRCVKHYFCKPQTPINDKTDIMANPIGLEN